MLNFLGIYLLVGSAFTLFRLILGFLDKERPTNMTIKGLVRYLLMEVLLGVLIWPVALVYWILIIYRIYHGQYNEIHSKNEDIRINFYENKN